MTHLSDVLFCYRKSSIGTVSHISLDSRKAPSFRSSSASLPSSLTPRSRSPGSPVKCPNVLVFSDSADAQENVKSLLRHTLKKYRYIAMSRNNVYMQLQVHSVQYHAIAGTQCTTSTASSCRVLRGKSPQRWWLCAAASLTPSPLL